MGSEETLDENIDESGTEAKRSGPLSYAFPSPALLFHYPLFATNVRTLCEKRSSSGQSSLGSTITSLRVTYRAEGWAGLYRGGHVYLLHQATRECLRFCAVHSWVFVEKMVCRGSLGQRAVLLPAESSRAKKPMQAWLYWSKIFTKYAIDVVCYPLLLASTRIIILQTLPSGTWARLCLWSRTEGVPSLFNGLTCSLASTALDEAMEMALESAPFFHDLDLTDKFLLKASAMSVVSIFTSPFNYVGVIQRCQSSLPGMLSFSPLANTVKSLPWQASMYQFFLFAGIFAMNWQVIRLKSEEQRAAREFDDEQHRRR